MWTAIDPRKLKIGHYVRIEHSWLSHPFPRSTFTITSQRDLQLIEEYSLKRISFDPGRSTLADEQAIVVNQAPTADAAAPTDAAPEAASGIHVAEPLRIKQRLVQEAQARRQRLETLSRNFVREARETAEAARLIDAGDAAGFTIMDGLASQAVQDSCAANATLSFAGTALASAALDQDSASTITAMSLAAKLGRMLAMDEEVHRATAVSAALRAISLRRLPPTERNRSTIGALPLTSALRNYPQISAELLERVGKIPESVRRMVAQHRECLDGSGFPQGLRGNAIAPGASLVGLVHEYQELTAPGRRPKPLSPSDAVRYLYQSRREQLGTGLMNQFIATLSVFPPGTFVRLSDDTVAVVVRVNPSQRLRPVVMMLEDHGNLHEGDITDLSAGDDLAIVSAFAADALPPRAASFAGLTDVIGLKLDTGPAEAVAA